MRKAAIIIGTIVLCLLTPIVTRKSPINLIHYSTTLSLCMFFQATVLARLRSAKWVLFIVVTVFIVTQVVFVGRWQGWDKVLPSFMLLYRFIYSVNTNAYYLLMLYAFIYFSMQVPLPKMREIVRVFPLGLLLIVLTLASNYASRLPSLLFAHLLSFSVLGAFVATSWIYVRVTQTNPIDKIVYASHEEALS